MYVTYLEINVGNSIAGMIPSEDEIEYLGFLILFLILGDKIHIT